MPVGDKLDGQKRLALVDVQDDIPVRPSDILDHIEAVLILAGEPLRNKKGGIFGEGVTHYRQATNGDNKPEIDDRDDEDVTKENNEL